MSYLCWLDLSKNKLTGKVLESLGFHCNINYFHWLDLSKNKLTGKIPESLKQTVHNLNLSNNELVENIPMGRSHFLFKILGAVGAVVIFIIYCLVLVVLWIRNLHSRMKFKQIIGKILEKVEHP